MSFWNRLTAPISAAGGFLGSSSGRAPIVAQADVAPERLARIMRTASARPYLPRDPMWQAKRQEQARQRPAPVAPAPVRPEPVKPAAIPTEISETVSVVMRRQIPVRDEPARSWIGGLPMMPKGVDWPVGPTSEYPGRGDTPLHFVAQIACADLPADLWGGLGPRTGWLLLFLNGQDWDVMSNKAATRVIHIAELGPEREPPAGIYPVHDETYTGPNYDFVRTQDEIPTAWRRWPIDIVTISNTPADGCKTPVPDAYASILYDGAAVADGPARPPINAPFTWRGALYVVDSIARALARDYRPPSIDFEEKLADVEWRKNTLSKLDGEIGRLQGGPASVKSDDDAEDEEARERLARVKAQRLKRANELAAARELIANSSVESLIEHIRESQRDYAQWRGEASRSIAEMREEILSRPLDTELTAAEWKAVETELAEDRQSYWLARSDRDYGVLPARVDHTLLDLAHDGLQAAQAELAADYYVSPKMRQLAPAGLVSFMEPYWRALHSNRPHRMGGLHDGIQSDPIEGSTKSVLLFQIASDDAMHWAWGDGGAYFVFTDIADLAKGDFSRLDARFENH